jgi:fermentation-respiration switch protein FrsA (DUF1100 family)
VLFALACGLAGCRVSALDRLIYFPDRARPPPPPGVEERRFTAADGVALHAWYAPAGSGARAGGIAAPTLLWSHGNGGNVANREEIVLALAARGLDVLAYDYRGYGKSSGTPNEHGVQLDAEAAWDDLVRRGVPPARIVAFGESLGGAVSLHLAHRRSVAGVAVVSTFTRLKDVARVHYGPLAVLAGDQFDALRLVRDLRVPLFVAHGESDEIVPFALGKELFAAAPGPKRFLAVPGAMHNDVFADPALLDALASFAREVAGAPGAP